MQRTPARRHNASTRLHHDAVRAHVAQAIGEWRSAANHIALAQRPATWPVPAQAVVRRYALRHALIHRAEAGDWPDAWRSAGDTSFLEAKCREFGVHEVETDVTRVAERCRTGGDASAIDSPTWLAHSRIALAARRPGGDRGVRVIG
jgi:hypothetical protein